MSGIKHIGIIFRIISFIVPFLTTAIRFRLNMWLSKSFNKSIGLFFLPVIFELILGFDKSQYEENLFLDSEDDF